MTSEQKREPLWDWYGRYEEMAPKPTVVWHRNLGVWCAFRRFGLKYQEFGTWREAIDYALEGN